MNQTHKAYKKNTQTCQRLLDELHEMVEELNHICRANKKSENGYIVNDEAKALACDTLIDIIEAIANEDW